MHGRGRPKKEVLGGGSNALAGESIYGAANIRNCEDGVECAGTFAENRAFERGVAGVLPQRRAHGRASSAHAPHDRADQVVSVITALFRHGGDSFAHGLTHVGMA